MESSKGIVEDVLKMTKEDIEIDREMDLPTERANEQNPQRGCCEFACEGGIATKERRGGILPTIACREIAIEVGIATKEREKEEQKARSKE